MMKVKILIAADQSFATDDLISSLGNDDSFELLDSVNTRKALVNALSQAVPDILILDINMPLLDGIDTLTALAQKYPSVITVAISDYASLRLITEIRKLGAKGYLLSNTPFHYFKKIVLEIYGGLNWGEYLENDEEQPTSYYLSADFKAFHLTKREIEVIQLMNKQFNTNEISDFLYLSEFAIQTIRENIFLKLGIQNENQLISFAKENKIVD